MSAIDFHVHAFPDKLAGKAISRLEASAPWKAVGGGTIKELVKSMDKADIDVSVVCAIATKPGQSKGILEWCRKVRCDRIAPLPSVHPGDPDAADMLKAIAKEGLAGIKLHPMYQDFAADDPKMDAIYAAARDNGLFVVLHCGLDISFPMQDDRAAAVRVRNIIDRHAAKDLKLICTHMGGWRAWDEADKRLVGTPVLFETSFSLKELGPERAAGMIRRHGVERVLLGSDWPWNSQADAIAQVQALPLTEQDKGKVLWSNAARLLV
ncbi:MAG: amidohydrolase family protein [Phycisphaerae bacterium]